MQTLFVCGYRRTGKDTFTSKIVNPDINDVSLWKIYRNPTSISFKNLIDDTIKYKRIAFADKLKDEVSIHYGIDRNIPDALKDTKYLIYNNDLVSPRDLYIEWAKFRRINNNYYWIEQVYNNISNNDIYVVSDFRYPIEFEFFSSKCDVKTLRVFRSEVVVSDAPSEHQLDNFTTDYIACPSTIDFNNSLLLFPQYSHYIYDCDF